jgi:exonuclease VII large subunit
MDNMEKMLQKLLAQIRGMEEKMDSNQKKAEAVKEELLARMKEDRKAEQEKMAADREDLLARMDKMDDKMAKADKQEEMLAGINAKMDATIRSIRSEVQETIHNQVENVREELNQKTEALHIELTDTYNDLQALKTSFDKHRTGILETINRAFKNEEPRLTGCDGVCSADSLPLVQSETGAADSSDMSAPVC